MFDITLLSETCIQKITDGITIKDLNFNDDFSILYTLYNL